MFGVQRHCKPSFAQPFADPIIAPPWYLQFYFVHADTEQKYDLNGIDFPSASPTKSKVTRTFVADELQEFVKTLRDEIPRQKIVKF